MMKKSITNKILGCSILLSTLNINAQIISTFAGTGTSGYSGDGGASTSAQINSPYGLASDINGNIYIAENGNARIRKISTNGIISTFAGNGISTFGGDGGAATSANLKNPSGIAFDAAGNLYIADTGNKRIRKVSTSGIITTIAGTGVTGFSGDGGAATNAKFDFPSAVAVDANGNVYVVDANNSRIRKINTTGIISTIAGTSSGGSTADGIAATTAQLQGLKDICVDANDNIYIVSENKIRKINPLGIITTVAGSGTYGFSGDGSNALSASFNTIQGVNIDASGNLYIVDEFNHRLRMINASGIISTVAGTGNANYSGDGGSPILADLNYPSRVVVDPSNNIYISDRANNRIRKITSSLTSLVYEKEKETLEIYPNPTSQSIQINAIDLNEGIHVKIISIDGKIMQDEIVKQSSINVSELTAGLYFIELIYKTGKTQITKFIKE